MCISGSLSRLEYRRREMASKHPRGIRSDMARSSQDEFRVIVVTPLGEGGKGGIDRVMDQLRSVAKNDPSLTLRFVASRGPHIATSPFRLLYTIALIVLSKWCGRVDVVHLNLSADLSTWRKVVIGWLCNSLRLPYVVHLHSGRYREFWEGLAPGRRKLVDALFRRAGAVIVLGHVWRELVVEKLPDIADRIFIVPNATATREPIERVSRAPVVLFLGRLGAGKGTPDLLRALAKLPSELDWRAVLAGDGAVAETRGLVSDLKLTERVDVPGWVGPAEVDQLLTSADILCLPSYVENLPMSVVEGMAAGMGIVTTPVGAVPDCIRNDETGLLVEPGDVSGLSAALNRLIVDSEFRHQLGSKARDVHRMTLALSDYPHRLEKPWRRAANERMRGSLFTESKGGI